jgi:hypothetical protein
MQEGLSQVSPGALPSHPGGTSGFPPFLAWAFEAVSSHP